MKFGNKKLGIILGGVGLALTTTGAGLLGAGTNAVYSYDVPGVGKIEVGIGLVNYGDVWHDGKFQGSNSEANYFDEIKTLRDNYESIKTASNESGDNSILKLVDETLKANDMMIAGAVLTSIFATVLLVGVAMFFLNKKNAK